MARDITQNITIKTTLQDGISKSVQKAATASTAASQKIDKNVRKNITMFQRMSNAIRGVRGALVTLKAAVPGLAALSALFAGGFGFAIAARSAVEFGEAMAEISTLVDTAVVDVGVLREGVLNISNTFGEGSSVVAKGLYQTISSGAVDAADSIELLAKAQKLAVAGVATTAQGVDLLTTAINAYGLEVEEATRVSDVMFETVKLGKTTIPELAGGIGRAIPLAATLGVTIEELGAAIAAMTKGGIATDEAIVSLRGTMSAFISPAAEAVQILGKARIDFSKSRFEAVGLVGVLQDLEREFGNQPDVIAAIIPNIRALTGVLALTGKQANEFRSILEQLRNSGGATEEAFQKFMEDPAYRARVAITNLKNAFLAMGDQIVLSFNEMIERGGGAERVAAQLELVGKGVGAAFGVMTKSIGEAVDSFADFTDKLGGAEKLGDLVQQTFLTIGDIIALGFKKVAQEVSRALAAVVGDLMDFAAILTGLGVDMPASFDVLAGSALGIGVQIDRVTKKLEEARATVKKFASDAGKTQPSVSPFGDLFDVPTKGAKQYAQALDEVWILTAQLQGLEVKKFLGGDTGLSETDRDLIAVIASFDELREKWKMLGDTGDITQRQVDKLIATFSGDDWKLADDYFGELFSGASSAAEDFGATVGSMLNEITPESLAFGQRLREIKWAIEDDKQAMLDYEVAMLRAQAVEATASKEQLDHFNGLIDRIKQLKQAQLDAEKSARSAKYVQDLIKKGLDYIKVLEEQREAIEKAADAQRDYAQKATVVLAELGAATAKSSKEQQYYERQLLLAQRDRQIAQFEGMEGFEEVASRIRSAYATMLDDIDLSNLEKAAEAQREYARQASTTLAELGRATATSFEDRLYYERQLLIAQRDRQLEQFAGMEGFEEVAARVRASYAKMLEGLDPANLQGFAGMIRGANTALEEFVVFAKDDAAFGFELMTQSLQSFSTGFGQAFVDFASGTATASEAFRQFAANMLRQLAEMTASRAAVEALGGVLGELGVGGVEDAAGGAELASAAATAASTMTSASAEMAATLTASSAEVVSALTSGSGEAASALVAAGASVRSSMISGAYAAAAILESVSIGSGVGGALAGGAAAGAGAAGGAAAGVGGSGPDVIFGAWAKGGVVEGGLSALKDLRAIGYGDGGPIVRTPHVAVVGEGRYDEAVVPLPDGRSVPVDLRGGNQSSSETNVQVSPNITISVQSLDPRGTVEVLLEPSVQKSLRSALTNALMAGSDAAFSRAVKGA